jgi:predicted NBD/HSP70 family sugar kinase
MGVSKAINRPILEAELATAGGEVWELQAHYLALGLVNVICVLSPERIVIGGGVMSRAGAAAAPSTT